MSKQSVSNVPSTKYAEEPQKSPLRWVLLSPPDKGHYKALSGWFRCKDFLNDCVAYRELGKEFSIYGFSNSHKCFDDVYYYMGVKHVGEGFLAHMKRLNLFLNKHGFLSVKGISLEKGSQVEYVLCIPRVFFRNTFEISWLSSFIRAGTFGKSSSLEEALEKEHTLTGGWVDKIVAQLSTQKYIDRNNLVFLNFDKNKNSATISMYNVHDAGFQTWLNSMEANDD